MRAMKKMVATGAFAGFGLATVIGSGAFACSPVASVQTFVPGTKNDAGILHPGQTVDVKIGGFPEAAGDIVVGWWSPGKDNVYYPHTDNMKAPGFTVTVQIPLTAVEGDKLFSATAVPSNVGDVNYGAAVFHDPDAANRATVTTVPWTMPVPPTTVAPTGTAPASGSTTPAPKGAPLPAGNARRAVAAPTAQVGKPQAAPEALPTAVKPPTRSVSSPGAGTPAAPLVALPAAEGQPVASVGDLWSGLTTSEKAPSLLEQAAPQRHSSGLPLGGILFGSGLVALAGVALASGRRQLAHSRIVRR